MSVKIKADLKFSAFSNERSLVGVITWNNFLEYKVYICNTETFCLSTIAAHSILLTSLKNPIYFTSLCLSHLILKMEIVVAVSS